MKSLLEELQQRKNETIAYLSQLDIAIEALLADDIKSNMPNDDDRYELSPLSEFKDEMVLQYITDYPETSARDIYDTISKGFKKMEIHHIGNALQRLERDGKITKIETKPITWILADSTPENNQEKTKEAFAISLGYASVEDAIEDLGGFDFNSRYGQWKLIKTK